VKPGPRTAAPEARPAPRAPLPQGRLAGAIGRLLGPYVVLATPENADLVTRSIVELTNHQRAENQAPPLEASEPLMTAARFHSREMAAANNMAHSLQGSALPTLTDRADAVRYTWSGLGENIAYNQADASSVVASWMNSPPHRRNMLDPSFTDIGVGLAWNARGEPYYTMMLGRRA
jgi:uncharacterized protein YkwD